jgi:biopolymer transport protein ExbB
MRRAARALTAFWAASSVAEGIEKLRQNGANSPYAQLPSRPTAATTDCEALPAAWPPASTRPNRWNAPCASN